MCAQRVCSNCEAELPADNHERKRKRPKKCQRCNNKAATARRHKDPALMLQNRWRTTVNRHFGKQDHLTTLEAVTFVYNACDKKSCMSGETNPDLLCISPCTFTDGVIPTLDSLVILTSKEAQAIGKLRGAARLAAFPQEVQDKMKNRK